ncbi:MAG TPA: TMEM165/GDT1 family protein [Frankiaceae bacterium]|nr:TMEM165/GDT1 family protein [Frankiaceae bacterium]
MSFGIIATVFGVVFVGELPDKTAVASLILGARYRPVPVLVGVWAAFLIHVTLACTAGGLVAKLPHGPVEFVTAALFLIGAGLLLRSSPSDAAEEAEENTSKYTGERSPRQVAVASFVIVLVAEFGDLTQILTATLAARYRDPLSVGIGALLALWAVAALAVTFGRSLLKVISLRRVQQLAAIALAVLAILSLISALR